MKARVHEGWFLDLDRDQILDFLRGSALLRGISPEDLLELSKRALRRRYRAGDVLFRQGDPGQGVMIVVRGRVKIVSVAESGAEIIHNIIDEGEVFGEISLLDGEPRSADAVVAEDGTLLLLVLRRDFLPILESNPDAMKEMVALLCRRIRQTTHFVEDALFLDAGSRLMHRIRGLAAQYGRRKPDGVLIIDHGLSQQELGDAVGLTRVSVNRHLATWREAGLIEYRRGVLEIADLMKLEDWVCASGMVES